MIVYVETNFLMEVARQQAQSAACATLLQMADSGTIRLTLPGCCLLEALRTLSNENTKRGDLINSIEERRTELAQQSVVADLQAISRAFQETEVGEVTRLDKLADRFRLRMIPWDMGVYDAYQLIQVLKLPLALDDAMVLASIVHDVMIVRGAVQDRELALFVTRDGDFSRDPEVRNLIRKQDQLHCKLLSSFKHAVNYLKNRSDPA